MQRCNLRGEPRGATHHVEEPMRERTLVLEGNQCYKRWRSLLIWALLILLMILS